MLTRMMSAETPSLNGKETSDLVSLVQREQIKILYDQIPFGFVGESLVAAFLCISLWSSFNHSILLYWFLFVFAGSDLLRGICFYYYRKNGPLFSAQHWISLFAMGAVFSGIGWGFAGSVLINTPGYLHQIFVIFCLIGMTAAASTFYSTVFGVYVMFLLLALLPFTWWLFARGDLYAYLGIGSLIYLIAMLINSYYAYRLLKSTLTLQFKILDLDSNNKLLESMVAERTAALEKALDFSKSTMESTTDGIIMVNSKGMVEYFNQTFLDLWKLTRESIAGQHYNVAIEHVLTQLKQPDDFMNNVKDVYRDSSSESFFELSFIDGKILECYSRPHRLEGEIVGHVWSFRDVTARNKLTHRANHDQLTELPNRALFYDRIEQGIAFAKRRQVSLTLLFVDLDDFKMINDSLGHNSGDQVLKEIGKRLKESVRESDTVARYGGDEFIILLLESEQTGVLQLAQTILKKILDPIVLPTQEVAVTASIGICMYPKDANNTISLIKNADLAMYLAKKKGRNNFQFYNEAIYLQSVERLQIQAELFNAVANNEFFLEYQPIISLKTSTVMGAEALVRWNHPTRGVLYPDSFISLTEKNGLINPLGAWIFREACKQCSRWQEKGLMLQMSINISCVQVKGSNFIELVEKSLNECHLDPKYLELELTERAIIDNLDQIKSTLSRFSNMGVQMAIDDFGIGYSSMNYLRAFPINKLKIDKSFVQDCVNDPNSAAIVKAIIFMGKDLNVTVLAEGVETEEQLSFLKKNQCDEAQGNLFCPAVDQKTLADLVTCPSKKRRKAV